MIPTKYNRSLLLALVAATITTSCAAPPRVRQTVRTPHRWSLVASGPEQAASPREYRIGFGDVIEIKFFNNERFNETVAVRPDGRITLQRMGDIPVAGMTPSRLDTLITVVYSHFLRNPEVTVFVREFGGYQVYVLGEVNSPGAHPIVRDMTLLQALAIAGGPKDSAKLKSVVVLRRGASGDVFARKVDLSGEIKRPERGAVNDVLYVHAQDVVYVPKTFIADVNTFLGQVYDGLLPPVDIYLRALLYSHR